MLGAGLKCYYKQFKEARKHSVIVKSTWSGARLLGFESRLCHLPAVCNFSIPLSRKIKIIILLRALSRNKFTLI